MVEYASGTLVAVRPFVHRPDGEATIIGDVDRKVYLAIPTEGLDILNDLAGGKTVGEAARAYETKHAESVDIDDFLKILAAEGFVRSTNDATTAEVAAVEDAHGHQHAQVKSFSFDWISPKWARRLTGKTVFLFGSLVILAGFAMIFADPGLVPGPKALLFEKGNFALLMVVTFIVAMIGVSLHEIAHAMAARSVGVSATLGISNLMYVLVAQTDISGIWMVSKGRRVKAYLAGFFTDLFFGSLLVAFLYASRNGIIPASASAQLWASAVLLTFAVRLLFQFFFYLRTDIYFVLAAVLNCKNLMADTERLLNNNLKRLTLRRKRVISQAGIPRKERRRVRVYAVFYVFGRTFSLWALIFTILPLLWAYAYQFVLLFGGRPTRFTSADFTVVVILAFLVNGGGLVMWGRNLYRGFLRRRARAKLGIAPL